MDEIVTYFVYGLFYLPWVTLVAGLLFLFMKMIEDIYDKLPTRSGK